MCSALETQKHHERPMGIRTQGTPLDVPLIEQVCPRPDGRLHGCVQTSALSAAHQWGGLAWRGERQPRGAHGKVLHQLCPVLGVLPSYPPRLSGVCLEMTSQIMWFNISLWPSCSVAGGVPGPAYPWRPRLPTLGSCISTSHPGRLRCQHGDPIPRSSTGVSAKWSVWSPKGAGDAYRHHT